jgi:hypothetical protein
MLKPGIFISKLRDLYSDLVLKTLEFLDDSSNFPDFREGGSEQIREGAQISQKPPTDDVERFLV